MEVVYHMPTKHWAAGKMVGCAGGWGSLWPGFLVLRTCKAMINKDNAFYFCKIYRIWS